MVKNLGCGRSGGRRRAPALLDARGKRVVKLRIFEGPFVTPVAVQNKVAARSWQELYRTDDCRQQSQRQTIGDAPAPQTVAIAPQEQSSGYRQCQPQQ